MSPSVFCVIKAARKEKYAKYLALIELDDKSVESVTTLLKRDKNPLLHIYTFLFLTFWSLKRMADVLPRKISSRQFK